MSVPLASASPQVVARTDVRSIDEVVRHVMHEARIPGVALGVVQGDQIIYLQGFGVAERGGRPVTPRTPFLIGSCTKSFTALAIMQLVEAGALDLDAPVTRYVPWFRTADAEASARITVRHLLHQTSGFSQTGGIAASIWTDSSDAALERRVRVLERVHLNRPVGVSYEYSNTNYAILGLIAQLVSGKPYEEVIEQRIFQPLGMGTSFTSQAAATRHGLATGHRWWFGLPVEARLAFNRADLPAGWLASSAEDLSHYLIAQLNGGRFRDQRVLSDAGVETLHRPAPGGRGYAMGWGNEVIGGIPVVAHDGGTPSYQASLVMVPSERLGVVVLVNSMSLAHAFLPSGVMARRIAAGVTTLLMGQSLPPPRRLEVGGLTLLLNSVVAVLSLLLLLSLARLPRWGRRLRGRWLQTGRRPFVRVALQAGFNLSWPIVLLLVLPARADFPAWRVMALFQPDLTYWAVAMAAVTLLKGVLEIAISWGALRRPLADTP